MTTTTKASEERSWKTGARAHVGIDPDTGGAIALIDAVGDVRIWDMPVYKKENGRPELDVVELSRILGALPRPVHVHVEATPPLPAKMGGLFANYSRGLMRGTVRTALFYEGLPYEEVLAAVWKRKVARVGANHADLVHIARCQFPQVAGELKLVKHHGRAAALLIAEHGRRVAP